MFTTYTLTLASIKMFLRNRQALFFSLFMPLMILFIFGFINFDEPTITHVGLVTHNPSSYTKIFIDRLSDIKSLVIHTGTLDDELAKLNDGRRTLVLDIPDNLIAPASSDKPPELSVYTNTGRPLESQMALLALNQFAAEASLNAAGAKHLFTVKKQEVSSHNFRYIEFILPGLLAMAIMQMSVFSVAFVFTQYKEKGVLKRLFATPMKNSQFLTANVITRLLMALLQAAIFILLGIFYFHLPINGSYALLALVVTLGSLIFLSLGFTISGIAKTVESVPVLANIFVFPMLFLSGVFFSINSMPPWLQTISDYLPLTFFADALRGVINRGQSFLDLKQDLLGMTIWAILLITLALFAFRLQEKDSV